MIGPPLDFLSVCVHTTREEFESLASFLQVGLPFTLILHGNRAFRKRSSKWRNLKTLALRFSQSMNLFEDDDVTIIMIFPCQSFPQTQIQSSGYSYVFEFLRRRVNGKHIKTKSDRRWSNFRF